MDVDLGGSLTGGHALDNASIVNGGLADGTPSVFCFFSGDLAAMLAARVAAWAFTV
jgi:hypothetical protein